ncbi:MAG: hypothetical protein Q8R55_03080 [Candidatus Taylorbacteria bacterium]|nr:hypothetical protein [Candidatus Taylorbacteria bacterium]
MAFNDKSNAKSQAGHIIKSYIVSEICRMFPGRFMSFLKLRISKIGDRIDALDMTRRGTVNSGSFPTLKSVNFMTAYLHQNYSEIAKVTPRN